MGNCPSDREKIDGLCYNKCDKGEEHVPGMPYLCRASGVSISQGRGVGGIPGCGPEKTDHPHQDGALCYRDPPKGYNASLAGTEWQQCPKGTTDFGVGCTRDSYTIGVGKFAYFWMIIIVVTILVIIGAIAYVRVRVGMITGV